jgi:hypothetical protein
MIFILFETGAASSVRRAAMRAPTASTLLSPPNPAGHLVRNLKFDSHRQPKSRLLRFRGRLGRGFRDIVLGVHLGNDVVDLLLGLGHHFAGLLAELVSATDRGLPQLCGVAASFRAGSIGSSSRQRYFRKLRSEELLGHVCYWPCAPKAPITCGGRGYEPIW